jgi:hypothetical protein
VSWPGAFRRWPLTLQFQLLLAAVAILGLWLAQQLLRTADLAQALARVQSMAALSGTLLSRTPPSPQEGPGPQSVEEPGDGVVERADRLWQQPAGGVVVRLLQGHRVLPQRGGMVPAPATAFERAALRMLAADPQRWEVFEVQGDRLLYLRWLPAPEGAASGGAASQAAAAMPLAISISWPVVGGTMWDLVVRLAGWPLWLLAAAWAGATAGLLLWVRWRVLHAALSLARYARRLLHAQPGAPVHRPVLDDDEIRSGNELHRLSAALKALQRALGLAQQQHRA